MNVLFRAAVTVVVLFLLAVGALTVTRSRLEPVLTGSMTPTIPRHSLILAGPVDGADLKVGDVVVFQPPDGYGTTPVMHRVHTLTAPNGIPVMQTKGDANAAVDPWTIDLTSARLYRVRAHVPEAGVVLQFMHNSGGNTMWPGLVLVIGAIAYALRLRRTRDDDDDPVDPADLDDLAAELRRTGHDIGSCAEQLVAGGGLEPRQVQVVRVIAEHARTVSGLAERLAGAEGDAATAAGGRARAYAPRHSRGGDASRGRPATPVPAASPATPG